VQRHDAVLNAKLQLADARKSAVEWHARCTRVVRQPQSQRLRHA
jgi:hypothetical protein